MVRLAILLCACLADALLGDPYRMPHIIRLVGSLIGAAERLVRRVFPATPSGERAAGVALVLVVTMGSCGATALVVGAAWRVAPWLGFCVEAFLCYQMLAARQLAIEARRVHHALGCEGISAARQAVSMIVGRDTAGLDRAGVIRAAVETVAENASDGFVAPLLMMALGGPVAGMLYKSVNTMDSMVGYLNDRYRYLGTAAARLDDVLNWVPARVTAALMCLVAPLAGLDGRGAWAMLLRDGAKHASPNSGRPEAACAGALGVRLAGPASYFGVVHDKPYIGDDTRLVEEEDILRACRLLHATALAAMALAVPLALLSPLS